MMKNKVMCVDDDQNILSAYKRHLRKDFQSRYTSISVNHGRTGFMNYPG